MEYRVLARKYRPSNFADLIGQDALVRTLSNAIASGRVAHAFLLTGIRGVGKTTTARIIARALNCEQGPTINPCGVCSHCSMIAADRHPDVLEMDAASRTGVDDIRDLIETVRYMPSSARTKIYIIDEVHMLSNNAFNALLKTLEEPPPHVKFIFATTEARKIPVTILSRCQRFDLKRIDAAMLKNHLTNIAQKESVACDDEALELLATAAEGSVRDVLSLLDQAIAHGASENDAIRVTTQGVRSMLGLADRTQYFDLLEATLSGDIAGALARLRVLYEAGADMLLLVQDMLELTHFLTRIKLTPALAADVAYAEAERQRAATLAGKLSIPSLARLWQMWLKGVSEVKLSPSPFAAVEMLLVRIAYAAELPTPAEVIAGQGSVAAPAAPRPSASTSYTPHGVSHKPTGGIAAAPITTAPVTAGNLALAPTASAQSQPRPSLELVSSRDVLEVNDFVQAVALFEAHKEAIVHTALKHEARLVSFADGAMELAMQAPNAREMASKAAQSLSQWTGRKWTVTLSQAEGAPTLAEQEQQAKRARIAEISHDPLVAKALELFPGAEVIDVLPHKEQP